MDPHRIKLVIFQFIAATVALVMFGITAFTAFFTLFSHIGGSPLSNVEANQLTNVELSQLVGTQNYARGTNNGHLSLVRSLASSIQPPLTNPLTMLQSQLPETTTEVASRNQMESTLFRSITSWANTSGKIAMGWIQSNSPSACIQMLKDNPGITVASPVWFHLNDASGNLSGHVLPSVVKYAHANHIKVWVLVDNQFNSSLTHKVLQNPKAATNMTDELAYQAKQFGLDGINVDFENVAASDRDAFTSFMKLLHQKLSSEHVDLSVDISPDIVPLRDNKAFFHAGLADAADHVVLMAYDEHWGSDPTPGPVADLPWVQKSVSDLLDTGVPTDKLVLGMPFYTRFWYIHKNGHVTNTAVSDGNVDSILKQHQATGTFNQNLDLMYVKYSEPDGYMESWYPNEQTFQDELSIVTNNGLAGAAVWSLELSDKQTWSSMIDALRQRVTS